MAEIVLGLLGPIIELGKFIAAPINRQFSYLCCFSSNIQILDEEAQNLENVRDGVQREVDTAERNAQVIDAQVKDWLDKVKKIQEDKSDLDRKIANEREGNCWSVKSRYSASRKAVKTAANMKQKRLERNDITLIAHGPLPTSQAADILERSTSEFESRAKIEEALMTMLKDENVSLVGICGMGGVGKTTLAEKIMNKLKKENIFGELVKAVVSQSVNKKKIQDEIAEKLGLDLDATSLSTRAERLCTRLMSGKRVLLVLDDVWEYLDLKEIGIPCKSGPEGCTILITSRDKRVLTGMGMVVLNLEVLSKEEAWSLFKEKLGTFADDQDQLSSLAREIADECSGLPLALVSVAGVLKDEKEIPVWRDTLRQLRSGNPEDLPAVLEKVYTPLKLSYDQLKNQNVKSIFLLCSLFPEDSYIDLENLTLIAMGLSMFEGIENLEPTRDRVKTLINMLKHRYLLLEGQDGHVKMHDVVRDVAIFIASKAPEEKQLTRCGYQSTWISPFVGGERIKFSKDSTFPNLRLLMIHDSKDEELNIRDISFEGMKELNVLFTTSNFSWTSLSLSQNLRTLILVKCESLETVSVVGDLWNLEILICRRCDAIKEFPSETLKSLKLLEISYCQALEKVGSAVVLPCSDERDFEQIKITFPKLESLVLRFLQNLRVFYQGNDSIEFPLLSHVQIEGCPQLKGLISSSRGSHMNNDDHDHSLHLFCKQKVSFGNLMRLELEGLTNCDNVFCPQIPVSSFSLLEEFTIFNYHSIKSLFSFSIAQNLKSLKILKILNCKEMVKVIEEEEGECSNKIQHITIEFPKLESLELQNLPNLRGFYQGNASIKFHLLDNLEISWCQQLKGLVSSSEGISMSDDGDDHSLHLICYQKVSFGNSMKHLVLEDLNNIFCPQIPIGSFTHLEKLDVSDCANNKILFPFSIAQNLDSLKKLKIRRLDEMEKVIEEAEEGCSHDTTLVFPHLEDLYLYDLPQLKTFCNSALGLPKLVNLVILHCPEMGGFNLGSVTTPNLESLESVHIEDCERNMEQVFWWSEVENENSGICRSRHVKFLNLRALELCDLSRLTSIFKGAESIEFPHLAFVSIRDCPNLKSVVSVTTFSNSGDINNEVVGKLKEQTSSIWDQISIGSFTTLKYLDIHGFDVISSLFSSSIARKLINLKQLNIERCNEMVKVIEEAEEGYSHDTTLVFPHLKELTLSFLPRLKTFCNAALGFPKLVKLVIQSCPEMGGFNLGSLTTPNLKRLESLDIIGCGQIMEQVFWWSEVENENSGSRHSRHVKFPNFRTLELYHLSRLTSIFKGVESIEFPHLTRMHIIDCPNLKSVVSATTCSNSGDINNEVMGKLKEQTFSICDQISIGSFSTLEYLYIEGFDVISSLFSSSIARKLINLKKLFIVRCKEIVKVMEEEVEEYSHETTLLFPLLEKILLLDLPQLKSFCEWKCALELPLLETVKIGSCPKVERFSLGSLTTPKFKSIKIEGQPITIAGDLNNVLQQRFLRLQEKRKVEGDKEKDEIKEEEKTNFKRG